MQVGTRCLALAAACCSDGPRIAEPQPQPKLELSNFELQFCHRNQSACFKASRLEMDACAFKWPRFSFSFQLRMLPPFYTGIQLCCTHPRCCLWRRAEVGCRDGPGDRQWVAEGKGLRERVNRLDDNAAIKMEFGNCWCSILVGKSDARNCCKFKLTRQLLMLDFVRYW